MTMMIAKYSVRLRLAALMAPYYYCLVGPIWSRVT
jgi:hypothetical protein